MARNPARSRGYVASLTNILKPLLLDGSPQLLGSAQVGVASTLRIVGATAGSTITVTSGTVPAGMTLNSAARTITGTPTTAGVASFTLTETLGGATGSPKASAVSTTILAPPNVDTAVAYTLVRNDEHRVVPRSNASTQTTIVPPYSEVPFPIGTVITLEQTGAGAMTVVAGAGVTLNKLASQTLTAAGQNAIVQLRKTAAGTWTVFGGLASA